MTFCRFIHNALIVMLGGGDKSTQGKDILAAQERAKLIDEEE